MLSVSHVSFKTPIRNLLEHLDAWREAEGWGRDKLAAEIVGQYEAGDGPQRYRVQFEKCADVFKRAHTNATRIFRWFQDDDKDTNLLSVNFLMPILSAMPRNMCMSWLSDFLRPLGLGVHSLNDGAPAALDVQQELIAIIKEGAESQQAVARLMSDKSPQAVRDAVRELMDSIEVQTRLREILEASTVDSQES